MELDWNEEGIKCTIGSAAGEGTIAQGCTGTWEKKIFQAKFQPFGYWGVGKRLLLPLQFEVIACHGQAQVTWDEGGIDVASDQRCPERSVQSRLQAQLSLLVVRRKPGSD